MRLSTAPDRDAERAIAVIHAALDGGVTLLDTADAYCLDDTETGHNERLIAAALRAWGGERSRVEVATKGGLRRPGGAWVGDGRARHLRAACEASRIALGVETIDLYQLHVVDPRTPVETSVRALAALRKEGVIRRIGLCNVSVGQIEAARAIVEIATIQVPLSVLDPEALRSGVAEYARDHGIPLIACRPLGGERRRALGRDPVLSAVATAQGTTPEEVALAWLMSFPGVLPIPGATRQETARATGHAASITLTGDQRARLDERFSGRVLRFPRVARRPPDDAHGEVVIVMGMPGAGKSRIAAEFTARGYGRLNRDARGGSLGDLVEELDAGLATDSRRWVLDNTYPSRASRNAVLECAWARGVPVRCVHLTTSLAEAQINAIRRMIEVHGRLPMPEELRELGRHDPRYLGPEALFRYERSLEPPVPDEGFTVIEKRTFTRQGSPDGQGRAVLLDYDDLIVPRGDHGHSSHAGDAQLAEGRREVLADYHDQGWRLFAHAWRPSGGDRHANDSGARRAEIAGLFARTRELLGLDIELACCTHDAGPPICWCRKPLPGLLIEFAVRHDVAFARSLVVGSAAVDRTLASRLGASFQRADDFFPSR